jgi:hypothetical protein
MNPQTAELAAAAARFVVEEGLEYAAAKRKAARALPPARGSGRVELPSNEAVEDEVRAHIALFHADSQPQELAALRRLALRWMDKLAAFEPLLTGAVWRGTANRWSTIHLMLYSDDEKAPEIALLNAGESPEPGAPQRDSRGRDVQTLQLWLRPPADPPGFLHPIGLHLSVLGSLERRGALLPDAQGLSQRGDAAALRKLLEPSA